MDDIIKVLKETEDFDCLDGALQEDIVAAEKKLDLRFAEDYRKYLTEFGLASAGGHEFTGIVKSSRLNVVDVTIRIGKKLKKLPLKAYVVEELNIDGIVILQTEDGNVYEGAPDKGVKRIAGSLSEYLLQSTKIVP